MGEQYYIYVVAHSASGDSDTYYYYDGWGNGQSFASPPDAPVLEYYFNSADVGLQNNNDGTLTLHWTAPNVNGASLTHYTIYMSVSELGIYNSIDTSDGSLTYYNATGLEEGTTYYFKIKAHNSAGDSNFSNIVSGLSMAPPDAPILAYDVDSTTYPLQNNYDGTLTLHWIASDTHGTDVTHYTIYMSTSELGSYDSIDTLDSSSTFYNVTNLDKGTTYYFKIIANSNAGDSEFSNIVFGLSVAPPDAPSINIINTHDGSSGTLTLSWNEPGNNGSPNNNGASVDSYKIYKSEDGGNNYDNGTDTVDTSYIATGLTNGQYYYFKITAHNSAGDSDFSNVVYLIALIPPTISINNNNNGTLTINWSEVNGEGSDGYDVYMSVSENSGYDVTNEQVINPSTFTFTTSNLELGTTYYFKVVGKSTTGNSEFSNIVSGIARAPSEPPALEYYINSIDQGLENNYNSKLTLHWTRPDENGTTVTGYKIYKFNVNTEEYDLLDTIEDSDTVSYQAFGLTLGTTYFFKIVATSDAGDSEFSNTVSGVSMAPPYAPVLLYYFNSTDQGLENNNNGTLTLHWLTSGENGTSVSAYNIYMSTEENGDYTNIGTANNYDTDYLINSNINAGTLYYFKIVATSDAGDSEFSNIVSGVPRSPPAAPYIFGINTSNNNRTLTLYWGDTQLNGSTVSTYEIYYSASADDGYELLDSNFELVYNEYSSLVYTTNQLTNGTYYFKIRTVSNAGNSDYSNVVSGLAIELAPAPNAPTATAANPYTDLGGVYVEWNNQSYDTTNIITGYYVTYHWNDGQPESYKAGVFYSSPAHIQGLTRNIPYTFTLSAVNDAGESQESEASDPITLPFACVIGSTKILMANGEYVQIKDIKMGDVLLEDIATGKTNIVSRIVKNNVKSLGKMIPKGLIGNTSQIVCARNHPIWINNEKNRIKAKHIKGTKRVLINEPLYNIQYDDFGTFYAEGIKMDSLPPVKNIDSLPLDMYIDKSKYYQERSDNGPEFITSYQPPRKTFSILKN